MKEIKMYNASDPKVESLTLSIADDNGIKKVVSELGWESDGSVYVVSFWNNESFDHSEISNIKLIEFKNKEELENFALRNVDFRKGVVIPKEIV